MNNFSNTYNISVTFLGISKETRFTQSRKVDSGMLVVFCGKTAERRLVQFRNTAIPMKVALSGIVPNEFVNTWSLEYRKPLALAFGCYFQGRYVSSKNW